ncbi:MAG TPA: preprotein translocase subunit SecG [Bryobacterales bacterium]|nr:preprotein translocase subunit SecG [Bryobacterales bacterium]
MQTALWLLGRPSAFWFYLFGPLLFFLSLFMILLILVQRGRGGGLAGALGGMGGQSAFGSKAGDVFTMITVVTASLWFLLSCLAIGCLQDRPKIELSDEPAIRTPAGTSNSAPAPSSKSGSSSEKK